MRIWRILGLVFVFSLALESTGLAQEMGTQTETNHQPQDPAAEQDLKQLREWVQLQSDKISMTTRAEWPSIKSEFARQASKIEGGFQSLSDQSKREFLELKTKFENLETKPLYDEIPLQTEEVKLREKDLLGVYSNIQNIKPTQMAQAYLAFIHSVRAKRQTWIPRDWDYAEYVLQKLASRKAAIEDKLNTLDEVKIRAWTGEFYTLRAGREFKENQKNKNSTRNK